MPLRIEDYAMIGDGQTAALVGRDSSIDWLCWPRFDSPSCFARILGDENNGRWTMAPRDADVKVTRRYRPNTLVLETQYETKDAAAVVIDFMPDTRPTCLLVRIVRGLRGQMAFRTELLLRPNYGVAIPWMRRHKNGRLTAVVGPDAFYVDPSIELHPDTRRHSADFTIKAGESVHFTLGYHLSFQEPPPAEDPQKLLEHTERRWRTWTKHFHGGSDYLDLVVRSLITLRALIYEPSGAIVAAPTTSLPEELGGSRNWDYRYCWLRDATFTLYALMNGGFIEEAKHWRSWLLRAIGGDPGQIQIMYGIGGEQRLPEYELPELAGYEGSKPVRVGNAAAAQLQIDIYGEVLDALYQARRNGLTKNSDDDWSLQIELLKHLDDVWSEPDEGIWEVRGGRQHFVYSKVMAWVAYDRAIKTVEEFGLTGPVDHWREVRKTIHADICAKGWNERIGAFTQSYGSDKMDASILLMPLTGFLPPEDPRIKSTVEAVETYLMKDGFILRYNTEGGEDGLTGTEGAFIACSFWFCDCLTLIGRRDEARRIFERLTGIATDLGFLSEEYDVANKRLIGNFPQAFSHIALINTAFNLRDRRAPAEERSGHQSADEAPARDRR